MNVLIINAHSSMNKGDAGIMLSMIDSLRSSIDSCNIKIKTRFPEVDAPVYDVSVAECIENIKDKKSGKIGKIKIISKLFRQLGTKYDDKSGDYEWADVVVSCGGGFLLTHGLSVMTLQHLLQIKVALDYKKPVVIYSQSIGPFYNKTIKFIASMVLKKVDKIFVREYISVKWLKSMGITESVEVVPDSAFSMHMQQSDEVDELIASIRRKHSGSLVGLTARDWHFPEVSDPQGHRARYVESLRYTVEHLEKTYQAKVLVMPQVLGPNAFNDDRIISREILNECKASGAELIDQDFNPRHLKYLYSHMDMFIGTRMHSNIFSLANSVPTVAINYEHKTKGIMELLELNDYIIDINEITSEKLTEMVDRCWLNRETVRQYLNARIPEVVSSATLPAQFIGKLNKKTPSKPSLHHTKTLSSS
ncbi:polysaccharide pyruvyl transferase family protein [Paenibacillus beijingensis]|uniref:Polysaccharide pyruvyl transferase n=1 Tax=Paenibacillus beijingensis TaxID=1126833 RepID=A0A0D5NG68_9BACL|nr:polysaccharide pyruvyl transferase family protein [Paenibacillus beijingensis]AJY73972.1 polysaccharide pyruvyl transferase [Paenibacillus beijingensis]